MAIVLYHALCMILVLTRLKSLARLASWNLRVMRWTLGISLVLVLGVLAPLLVFDPRAVGGPVVESLSLGEARAFILFALFTMVVHVPLEELFWRGIVLDRFRDGGRGVWANVVLFWALHGAVLQPVLGLRAWILTAPTGLAGGIWAWVTLRTGSIWPALVSHLAVCAAMLGVVWHFFVKA